MRLIGDALLRNLSFVKEEEERKFEKLCSRSRQPGTSTRASAATSGSPDAAEELNTLDDKEQAGRPTSQRLCATSEQSWCGN